MSSSLDICGGCLDLPSSSDTFWRGEVLSVGVNPQGTNDPSDSVCGMGTAPSSSVIFMVCVLPDSQIPPGPILHIPECIHGPPSVALSSRIPEPLSFPCLTRSCLSTNSVDLIFTVAALHPEPHLASPPPQSCSLGPSTLAALSVSVPHSAQSSHTVIVRTLGCGTTHVPHQ